MVMWMKRICSTYVDVEGGIDGEMTKSVDEAQAAVARRLLEGAPSGKTEAALGWSLQKSWAVGSGLSRYRGVCTWLANFGEKIQRPPGFKRPAVLLGGSLTVPGQLQPRLVSALPSRTRTSYLGGKVLLSKERARVLTMGCAALLPGAILILSVYIVFSMTRSQLKKKSFEKPDPLQNFPIGH